MRRLIAFDHVTLDGYFSAPNGDIGWAHRAGDDSEWNDFVASNASGGGALLLGRVTYDMMAGYWPTPLAAQNDPVVAERMNAMPKIVVSRTLQKATWGNATLVRDDLAAHVRHIKSQAGPGIAILGSGSLVAQLAQEGLIDEFQIVVNPVAIGAGRTLFEGLSSELRLRLIDSRRFRNGNVVLRYEPGARA